MDTLAELRKILDITFDTPRLIRLDDISQGARNLVYRVTLDGSVREVVVKLYQGREAIERAKAEGFAYETLRQSSLVMYIPFLYALDFSKVTSVYPYSVMSVLPGQPLSALLLSMSSSEREDIARQLAVLMATLNKCSIPFFGDVPPDENSCNDWGDYFSLRLRRGLANCVANGIVSDEFMSRCIKAVDARRDALICTHASLTHGDLTPKNVNVSRASGDWLIVGIYDFEFASASCRDWEFAQVKRSLFTPFSETLDPFMNAYDQEIGIPENFWNRLKLYDLQEAIQFWNWGIDYGFNDEISKGVDMVSNLLRTWGF